jgi:hypothetical protein
MMTINAWNDDPGEPSEGRTPVERPTPDLASRPLALAIADTAPAVETYRSATPDFRYWAAAEAARRAADFWASILPNGSWNSAIGSTLTLYLDEGADLNAYYDRIGLKFFHGTVVGHTVYSGESPDIVCHELGHAILDGLKPQLWDAMTYEIPAFHEFFGDASALLAALQDDDFVDEVLDETGGKIEQASRWSRLAEQLGWSIRQVRADVVDPDCLRNAANAFFYQSPLTLPASAPATTLSSEPHSFSRVFTAAFFEAIAGVLVVEAGGKPTVRDVQAAGRVVAQLLVSAVADCPVVPSFFSQVAAHMVAADAAAFNGDHRNALLGAFMRHGILSLDGAAGVAATPAQGGGPPARGVAAVLAKAPAETPQLRLKGAYGELLVHVAAEPRRFSVTGAAPDIGSLPSAGEDRVASAFVEELFRRGRIALEDVEAENLIISPIGLKTHVIRREEEGLALRRRFVDCGFSLV